MDVAVGVAVRDGVFVGVEQPVISKVVVFEFCGTDNSSAPITAVFKACRLSVQSASPVQVKAPLPSYKRFPIAPCLLDVKSQRMVPSG